MTVLITGATGLIGQELVKLLQANSISVNYLTTSKSKIENNSNYKGFYWNPKANELDSACFEGVKVIIHLAGASIAKRWTTDYKKEIISSRVDSANVLIQTLKTTDHTVEHVISSSAIGIYPDSEINYYEEDFTDFDDSFLSTVVQKWEDAVDGFAGLGIPVSKVRTGLVLSGEGGALEQMAKPVKYGLGAPLGSGKQWQSWIHIQDLVAIYFYILKQKLSGTFNGVAPNPVTNNELTKAIANQLNRPLILPNVPEFMLKLLLGDMYTILVESQRVSSKKIEDAGFYFEYNSLRPALEHLLS